MAYAPISSTDYDPERRIRANTIMKAIRDNAVIVSGLFDLAITSGTSMSKPAGVKKVLAVSVAAGGGGGSASLGQTTRGGGGGSSGGVAFKIIDVSAATTFYYTIGSGGTGSANSNGADGGHTEFNDGITQVYAYGGKGGEAGGTGGILHKQFSVPGGDAVTSGYALPGNARYSPFKAKPGAGGGLKGGGGGGCTAFPIPIYNSTLPASSWLSFGGGDGGAFGLNGSPATLYGSGGGGTGGQDVYTDRVGGSGSPGIVFLKYLPL